MDIFNTQRSKKWLGVLPLFDPLEGSTLLVPEKQGKGWWKGAPSIVYDHTDGFFYLFYRIRRPKPKRGVECRLARSRDGFEFRDIWSAKKKDFNSPSIERGCLLLCPDGVFRLYLSYVDGNTNKWRIDLMEAPSPWDFDPNQREKVLVASDINVEGVKDPYVTIIGRKYYMLISYAAKPGKDVTKNEKEKMHETGDVYDTGIIKGHTGLAVSYNGKKFHWEGNVLSPVPNSWYSYGARITSVFYTNPVFTAFFDGLKDVEDNYEEKSGIAISKDLKKFEVISRDKPILTSPYSSNSLRYIDLMEVEKDLYFYYEFARKDGSHETRVNRVRFDRDV